MRRRTRTSRQGVQYEVFEVVEGTNARRRVVHSSTDYQTAREAFDARALALATGTEHGPPRTVADLMDVFLAVKTCDGATGATLDAYRWHGQAVARGILGPLLLSTLTRADLLRHVQARLGDGRSPATVNGEIAQIRMALGLARERGWWRGDLKALTRKIDAGEPGEVRWLRRAEVAPFLVAIDGHAIPEIRIAVRLALRAGTRAGETVTRCWEDLDWDTGLLLVAARGGWRPKGRRARRVPVSDDLLAELRAYWAARGKPERGLIVPSTDGSQRTPHSLEQAIERALSRAARDADTPYHGPTLTYHELRHTFASLYLESGGNLFELSRTLGHASVRTTERMYAHVADTTLRAGANRLDEHVAGRSGRSGRASP